MFMAFLTSELFQTSLAGAVTKGIGSYFRIRDDYQAPPEVRNNTIKRESLLVVLTTGFTAAAQVATSTVQKKMNWHSLGHFQRWVALGPICAGIFLAESTSRIIAPKPPWSDRLAKASAAASMNPPERDSHHDDDHHDRPKPPVNPAPQWLIPPAADVFTSAENRFQRINHAIPRRGEIRPMLNQMGSSDVLAFSAQLRAKGNPPASPASRPQFANASREPLNNYAHANAKSGGFRV